jgi:Ankyrin repeats (many copies)
MTSDSTQDKELLERYRRASDTEAAAPSEAVRAAILAEGRRAAAQRANQAPQHRFEASRPAANDSRWKITAFGTAGAAILAALLFAPRYWESPQMAPVHADNAPAAAPMSQLASKSERAPPSQSADAAAAPPVANVAPAPQEALSAPAEEAAVPAPRKDLRIVPERPRSEAIGPPVAAQNYAPTSPLAAPAAPPPALASGARSMSADRMSASLKPPVTPLVSAVASGDMAQATELLDHGAAVDARDELGRTALMLAVARDRPDIIRLMLDRGADPNAVDNAGQTPLQQAKQKNLSDVAALLERAGAR